MLYYFEVRAFTDRSDRIGNLSNMADVYDLCRIRICITAILAVMLSVFQIIKQIAFFVERHIRFISVYTVAVISAVAFKTVKILNFQKSQSYPGRLS